ncbi:MAG TPA: peptidylprolyl isomerase, partial [Dermatophilaceae bacterium]|nr:peptidylprolyl isomerase [Dermatophilaceae bacterium]
TVFGEVSDDDSRQVVDRIAAVSTGANDRPKQDVVIERVSVAGPDDSAAIDSSQE